MHSIRIASSHTPTTIPRPIHQLLRQHDNARYWRHDSSSCPPPPQASVAELQERLVVVEEHAANAGELPEAVQELQSNAQRLEGAVGKKAGVAEVKALGSRVLQMEGVVAGVRVQVEKLEAGLQRVAAGGGVVDALEEEGGDLR